MTKENRAAAGKRVKADKGSAGVEGRAGQGTGEHLKQAWPDIRARRLKGSYQGQLRIRAGAPKGRPQAGWRLLQVLQPLIDPTLSAQPRLPTRTQSARGGIEAQQYVQARYRLVVDLGRCFATASTTRS